MSLQVGFSPHYKTQLEPPQKTALRKMGRISQPFQMRAAPRHERPVCDADLSAHICPVIVHCAARDLQAGCHLFCGPSKPQKAANFALPVGQQQHGRRELAGMGHDSHGPSFGVIEPGSPDAVAINGGINHRGLPIGQHTGKSRLQVPGRFASQRVPRIETGTIFWELRRRNPTGPEAMTARVIENDNRKRVMHQPKGAVSQRNGASDGSGTNPDGAKFPRYLQV